jgi:hypothetical protein
MEITPMRICLLRKRFKNQSYHRKSLNLCVASFCIVMKHEDSDDGDVYDSQFAVGPFSSADLQAALRDLYPPQAPGYCC